MKYFAYLLLVLSIISCNRTGKKTFDSLQYDNTIDIIKLVNDFDSNFNFGFTYTDY